MNWLKSMLIALDQLINTLLGGWPDETLSSRAWRWELAERRSWPRWLIDRLFFWENDHCKDSYLSERLGRQLPPEMRD
ncbi:MAG: pseudouridine synthase [Desulfovibrionaceae bacterium]|nr:pseudouridine synthase [Desulfovibrionaceae bacterium]